MMIVNQWESCKICGKPKCYVVFTCGKEQLVCKDGHEDG